MVTGHRYDFRKVGTDMIIEMVIKTNGGSLSYQSVLPVIDMIGHGPPCYDMSLIRKSLRKRSIEEDSFLQWIIASRQEFHFPGSCSFENHLLHNKCNTSNNMCWIQQYCVPIQMAYGVCDWVNIQYNRSGK